MADEPENLVLVQLRGIRRELAAVLENQARHGDLIARLFGEVAAIRSDVQSLKSDMVLLDNKLLNRHNELLGIMSRLDEAGITPAK